MINHLQYKSGFPINLPYVGLRVFDFKPGINILFGANGVGKSVILNTLKAYCGIALGGWTDFNSPEKLASAQFPLAYMALAPDRSMAYVDWDGTPTFFNDGTIRIDPNVFFNKIMRGEEIKSTDGILSENEQLEIIEKSPSTGQYRAIMTNKILNKVRNVPVLNEENNPYRDEFKYKFGNNEVKFWKSLTHTGPQTILLDEPERALSIPMQQKLFHNVLPLFADLQLIIATHSIFALGMKNVHFIEFEPGYINLCQKSLHEMLA